MKRCTKYFLMVMLCLIINLNNSYSQDKEEYVSHPDTLQINLSDGQVLVFAFENIKSAQFNENFISRWVQSIEKIEAVIKLESYDKPVRVSLTNKIVENEQKDVVEIIPMIHGKSIYMSRNGHLQNLARFNEIVVDYDAIKIKALVVQLNNLEALKKLDLKKLQERLDEVKKNIYFDKRKAFYLNTNLKDDSFSALKISDAGVADNIELTGGIGAGVFRDKIVPEMSFNVSLNFRNKHGVYHNKFGVQTSFHYMFERKNDGNYDMSVNTFVTGYFLTNTSKSTLKDKWSGIGIGYLINNKGGYFGQNTFKTSMYFLTDYKGIDIIPELIITDNFKTVFPSLRFGLTF